MSVEANISNISVLKNKVLFEFLDVTASGRFHEQVTESGIIVKEDDSNQVAKPRWGKVLKIGDSVDPADIPVGKYILVEALKWTTKITLDDEHAVWLTDDESVMAVSDTKPTTI